MFSPPDPAIIDIRSKILGLFDHVEMREGRYETLYVLLCEYTDGIMDRERAKYLPVIHDVDEHYPIEE